MVVGSGALPFPTTVGDSWTYTNTNGTTSENKIASATQVAAGQQVTMDTTFTDNGTTTHDSYEYIVEPNGEISLPTSQFAPSSSGVTFKVISGGIYWPSAAQLASGQPVHTTLTMEFTVAGKTQTITEHITSQGQGTQTVTVPAGPTAPPSWRFRNPRTSRATARPSMTRPGSPAASARSRAS